MRTTTAQVDESTLECDLADALLDQARTAGDPFLAVTLYQKILQARPNDTTVMGEAADLMLHVGETAAAKEVWAYLRCSSCHGESCTYTECFGVVFVCYLLWAAPQEGQQGPTSGVWIAPTQRLA